VSSLPVGVQIGTSDTTSAENEEAFVQVKGSGLSMSSMGKRLMWAGLVMVMMAAAGLLARRMSATIWRTAIGEEPPTESVSPS